MPINLGDGLLRFLADTTQTDRAYKDLEKKGKRATDKTGKQFDKLKGKASGVGAAVKGVALAFGAWRAIQAVKDAIVTMGNFETQMNRVRALTGATGKDFDALKRKAMELGSTTQFTASQVADAMGFMAQAGLTTDQILGATNDTLNLAASAQLDMASAADIVTNVMSGFGIEADEVGGAVDVLAKAFTSANTDLSQLGNAMKLGGPVAKSFGLTFEETSASIALMGNAGFQGTLAGTALRGALVRLANNAKKFGLEVFQANGKIKPMADIMDLIREKGLTATEMMDLFGQRAGPAMTALLSQGSDALRAMTHELENSGGTAENIASIQMEGLNGAILRLKSAWEGMIIKLGELGVLDAITGMVNSLIETIPFLGRILAAVSLVISGLVLGLELIGLGIQKVILFQLEWEKRIKDFLGIANNLDQEIQTLKFSMDALRDQIDENVTTTLNLWDAAVGTTEAIKDEGKEVKKTTKDLKDLTTETQNARRAVIDWEEQMEKTLTTGRRYKRAMVDIKEELARFVQSTEDDTVPAYVKLAEHNEIARQALLGMGVAGLNLTKILGLDLPEAMEPAIDRMGQLGDMAERAFGRLRGAAEQAIAAAIISGESIPKAMRKAVAGAIAALAAQALVEALMQTAFGFAALARLDFKAAGEHFTSAAFFGAVGGVAAIAGHALAPKGTQTSTITNPDGSPGGIISSSGPTQATTVRGLGDGGLITKPTLALLAERGEPEVVTPLARSGGEGGALDEGLAPGGSPSLQIIINGGLVSADTVVEFAQMVSQAVRDDDLELVSSEAITVVRRS